MAVVVVAAAGQELPPLPPGVQVVHDAAPDNGPLQGLLAGLHALAGRCDAAFVAACDLPGLTPELVRAVLAGLGDAAAWPIQGLMRHFRPEVERRIYERRPPMLEAAE